MNLNFFLGEAVLWYSIYVLIAQIRTTWVTTTYLFTYASKLKNNADSKYCWKLVELSKLEANLIYLDKFQWTLKSSHTGIRTTFVLRCRQNAKQFKAHSIKKKGARD